MFILAIETPGPFGSTALLDQEGNVLGFEVSHGTMSHLKDLIPMIDTMLKKCGVSKDQIDLIAPSVGPGSFTGIRIGVSTARALCQALGIKAVPVPTLEAFCFKEAAADAVLDVREAAADASSGGQAAGMQADSGRTAVCAIINARRGQVYGMIDGFMEPGPYMLTDVIEAYKSKMEPDGWKLLFFGDGVDAYEKDIIEALGEPGQPGQPGPGPSARFEFVPESDRYQEAVSVGRWAAKRIRECGAAGAVNAGVETDVPAGDAGDSLDAGAAGAAAAVAALDAEAGGAEEVTGCAGDYEQLLPDYMRRAEAEQKLESGELPICRGPKQE